MILNDVHFASCSSQHETQLLRAFKTHLKQFVLYFKLQQIKMLGSVGEGYALKPFNHPASMCYSQPNSMLLHDFRAKSQLGQTGLTCDLAAKRLNICYWMLN